MEYRRGLSLAARLVPMVVLLCPGLGGCAILNGFLDPTKVGQFPADYREQGVRRILTPRDTPPGLPNATEPTPEDLVPRHEDYRVAPGDVLMVNIDGLITPGVQNQQQLPVSDTGNVRIPRLGSVKVTGLTEQELENELTARLRDAKLLPDPDVQVLVLANRQRTYTIRGSVGRAGVYPIPEPDTRLLDVIGQVQDIGPSVQRLYVIRRAERGGTGAEAQPEHEPETEGLIIPPPAEEANFSAHLSTAGGHARPEPPATRTAPPEPTRAELEEVLAPRQASQPATTEAAPELEPALRPIIFDPQTGELVNVEPGPRPSEPARVEPAPVEEEPATPKPLRPFDWEEVPELELEQRVIEIDARALLAGDPRYNIVIREKDVINVPVDTGIFYLMGEINRPGVFAFNGRDITIKQAVALAGGLGPFAWPMRCEIIRHEPGTDKQVTIPVNLDAIWAGLQEDVYLRDDDIVNVGTHFVSPFLFVIRNSFRFTYGFGFVYDRNFADQDAVAGKQNPETLRQARRSQLGLPF